MRTHVAWDVLQHCGSIWWWKPARCTSAWWRQGKQTLNPKPSTFLISCSFRQENSSEACCLGEISLLQSTDNWSWAESKFGLCFYCLVIVEYGDSKFDHHLMSVTCLWLGQIITGLEEVIVGMKPGGLSIATQSKVCVYGESVAAVVTN